MFTLINFYPGDNFEYELVIKCVNTDNVKHTVHVKNRQVFGNVRQCMEEIYMKCFTQSVTIASRNLTKSQPRVLISRIYMSYVIGLGTRKL